jgi:hypothetical protein
MGRCFRTDSHISRSAFGHELRIEREWRSRILCSDSHRYLEHKAEHNNCRRQVRIEVVGAELRGRVASHAEELGLTDDDPGI